MTDFKKELTSLLNKHGWDDACETPDFILAEYVEGCLLNLTVAMTMNINWHTGWERMLGEVNENKKS
ncbi:MAG: hypothetical protein J6S85_19860 [Methanobrevibacter sp.]|nr:hypothetical protein [Methanobrevibacter sp.]